MEGIVDEGVQKKFTIGFAVSDVGENSSKGAVEWALMGLGMRYRTVRPIVELQTVIPSLIGVPYLKGASVSKDAPAAFDCSSLVAYVYVRAGFALPRVSVDQYVYVDHIEERELTYGDLIFSNTGIGKVFYETFEYAPGTPVPEGVDHVGMYIGEGTVVHATELAGVVVKEKLRESPRFTNIVGCGRVPETLSEERFVVELPEKWMDLRTPGVLIEILRKELKK